MSDDCYESSVSAFEDTKNTQRISDSTTDYSGHIPLPGSMILSHDLDSDLDSDKKNSALPLKKPIDNMSGGSPPSKGSTSATSPVWIVVSGLAVTLIGLTYICRDHILSIAAHVDLFRGSGTFQIQSRPVPKEFPPKQ